MAKKEEDTSILMQLIIFQNIKSRTAYSVIHPGKPIKKCGTFFSII